MKRDDLHAELIAKKEIGKKDFQLLPEFGTIGLYEECELTHVFLIEEQKIFHHYYALISFEEFTEPDKNNKEKNITDELFRINKKFRLGIVQKRISLEESSDIFNQLCKGSYEFQKINFKMPEDMQLLPKTQIPSLWGYSDPMVNKILKPNLWGDKYILEFSALNNPFISIFDSNELEKINDKINELISINLSSVYDRIGSFIFQFPITVVSAHSGISRDWANAKISLSLHSLFKEEKNLLSVVTTKLDDIVTGHHSIQGKYSEKELEIGDSNNLEFKVFNTCNGIIYKHSMGNFVRNFSLNMGVSSQNSEPRTIIDCHGKTQEIHLSSYSLCASSGIRNYYDSRTKQRIVQNDILNKSGRFLNVRNGEREKALAYIKKQITEKSASCSEIWLWDPFLNDRDIIDTIYYANNTELKMKCITSYKKYKDKIDERNEYNTKKLFKLFIRSLFFRNTGEKSYLKFKEEIKQGLLNNSNNLCVNLDFRAVHDNFGFDFHDRFLFFIPKDTETLPTVFSLGTSVNGLGKSHHLIQQTLDPRNIIETFNELWKLLDNDESRIIMLPEVLNDR